MTDFPVYGVNVGHGYTKVVINSATTEQSVVFPSMIASAEAQVAGALEKIQTTKFGDRSYWVGNDALLGRELTFVSQARLSDPVFIPVLVRAALKKLRAPKHAGLAVTGLPASWADDHDLAMQLGQRLRDATDTAFSASKIHVISEPLGALYAMALDADGQLVRGSTLAKSRVAVVDIGHYTVDVIVIDSLKPEAGSSASFNLGTSGVLNRIGQKINARYDLDLTPFEIDRAIRDQGLMVAGSMQPLPNGTQHELIESGREIAARLASTVKSSRIQTLLIAGGGAELQPLASAIAERFPQAVLVPNPQLSIATGYARYARRAASRMK